MCTWTLGASIMTGLLSATGGEQTDQIGHHVGLGGVVDERAFLPALDQPGAPQEVEMVRQRRPGDLELRLDVADGRLAALLADEEEEDLEPGAVRERLERFDVLVGGLEP